MNQEKERMKPAMNLIINKFQCLIKDGWSHYPGHTLTYIHTHTITHNKNKQKTPNRRLRENYKK